MAALMQADRLSKRFGSLTAVDAVSFDIEAGSCLGLLGPNGAGKTTTVEMLEGLIEPTSGHVLYQGAEIDARFTHDAGIMFQNTALQDFITVREALVMFSRFYARTVALDNLIEQCALAEFIDQDTRKLSGGQRQRLLLAIALINDPTILFLDEPTTGLDPQARRNFWTLLGEIRAEGKTVVLTTHYMEEARTLCDRLLFMDHGRIIASGSPQELLSEHFDDSVLELPASAVPETLALQHGHAERSDGLVRITSTSVNDTLQELLQHAVPLDELRIRERNLDDLFLSLARDTALLTAGLHEGAEK